MEINNLLRRPDYIKSDDEVKPENTLNIKKGRRNFMFYWYCY